MLEHDVLEDFYALSDYLGREGKIRDLERHKKYFPAFLLHASHIKAYDFVAPLCKGKKVLDIGCFLGYGEGVLADYAKQIVAVDNDDKAIEFAAKNHRRPNVTFEKTDARRLPFCYRDFDVVVAFQFIEHIPAIEVKNFLCEVKRVLKGGGMLFITTPNRKFRLLPLQRPFNPEHYQEFTAKRLFKTLKTVFHQVEIKGIGAKEWVEKIERQRVRKSPYRVYIRTHLSRLQNTVFPVKIKMLFERYLVGNSRRRRVKRKKSIRRHDAALENKKQFDNLFKEFTMNDLFLNDHQTDKSMDLFAICKK